MSHRLCLLCFSCLIFASCQRPPEVPDSILTKAIAAHGGAHNIGKPRMGMLKTTNKDIDTTQEEIFDLPRRWKRTSVGSFRGEQLIAFNVMIEGKFWEWEEGGEVRQSATDVSLPSHYFRVLTDLLEFTTDKVKLSALDELKIKGQAAVGVRAIRADGAAVDNYFDKTNGLLLQQAFKYYPKPGKEWDLRVVLGDYREVDGVKFPFRRVDYINRGDREGYVEFLDTVVTELKMLSQIPDETFSLPRKR